MEAEKSVYCGPLKMLAFEVFQKTNSKVFAVKSVGHISKFPFFNNVFF